MAGDIDRINKEIASLWANINSMSKTASENLTKILISQNSAERWQENHEKLDEERWHNLEARLGEIKGLIESVPLKVAEDLTKMDARITAHEHALTLLKGAWLAVTVGLPAVYAFIELVVKKGGH